MTIIILALLGLAFGSFINALVWRMHQQEKGKSKKDRTKYSIKNGRSMCVHCKNTLSAKDLTPVLSWIWLRGKCRYCKKPISWQYPTVEISAALLFVSSYVLWPGNFDTAGTISFAAWLILLTGFVALAVYDLKWMLLPNRIIFPLYGVAAAYVLLSAIAAGSLEPVASALWGVIIGGGLFYVLFQVSRGKWIGGGDVKLGFLLGAVVGGPANAVLMLFLASLLGVMASMPLLLSGKVSRTTRVPFGPFLIAAAIVVQLLGEGLIVWYLELVIGG
jgi:prepilin signal peptidase PulO-like enzyme (type II secretory pathway)